jgi:hypothetical protein
MYYPEQFTENYLMNTTTVISLQDGNEIKPYIDIFVERYDFMYLASTFRDSLTNYIISDGNILILRFNPLSEKKVIEIKKRVEIANILGTFTVLDDIQITRMLKISNILK